MNDLAVVVAAAAAAEDKSLCRLKIEV